MSDIRRHSKIILYLVFLCYSSSLCAKEEDNPSPPREGNFSLDGSQQPGSLIAFGGNILNRGQSQLSVLSDLYVGNNASDPYSRIISDITPSFLYAFTDRFTGFFVVPYAPRYETDVFLSSGIEDVYVQLEYAFYVRENKHRTKQGTIVANATFPTGSVNKNPATGNGAMSYFLGFTYNQIHTDYYGFTSQGFLIPTVRDGTHNGNGYYYQFGLGKNFAYKPDKWIFAGGVELDGQYFWRSESQYVKVADSGGNIIHLMPNLWFSTEHLTLQLGVGFPVIQHLLGDQIKFDNMWVANIAWTFDSPQSIATKQSSPRNKDGLLR